MLFLKYDFFRFFFFLFEGNNIVFHVKFFLNFFSDSKDSFLQTLTAAAAAVTTTTTTTTTTTITKRTTKSTKRLVWVTLVIIKCNIVFAQMRGASFCEKLEFRARQRAK